MLGHRTPARSTPLRITLRDIHRTNALESYIADLGGRLQRLHDRIARADWVVERLGADRGGAQHYGVKIHLQLPGAQIHADNLHAGADGDVDVYQALRDAFENAKRQLRDLQRYR